MDNWKEKVRPKWLQMQDVKAYVLSRQVWVRETGNTKPDWGIGDDLNTFAQVARAYGEHMDAHGSGSTNNAHKELVAQCASAHVRLIRAAGHMAPFFEEDEIYAKAHRRELLQLYVSRTCNGLTIAVTIFGMYWLADCMGIALPARFVG